MALEQINIFIWGCGFLVSLMSGSSHIYRIPNYLYEGINAALFIQLYENHPLSISELAITIRYLFKQTPFNQVPLVRLYHLCHTNSDPSSTSSLIHANIYTGIHCVWPIIVYFLMRLEFVSFSIISSPPPHRPGA